MKEPLGVRRLDEILGGGVDEGTTILAYGPAFGGHETLAERFTIEGLSHGEPVVMILTDGSATEARRRLAEADPKVPAYQRDGLLQFVDVYSRAVGAMTDEPGTEYVEGLGNTNGVLVALNSIERRILKNHARHRVVIDSVSTMIVHSNVAAVFRFLQVLVGRVRAAGATPLALLEGGMHTDAEVETIKHLVQLVAEFRTDGRKQELRVTGKPLGEAVGWIEYRLRDHNLDITGPLTAGRIR